MNDLVTCGALPITVAMHAAVGDSAGSPTSGARPTSWRALPRAAGPRAPSGAGERRPPCAAWSIRRDRAGRLRRRPHRPEVAAHRRATCPKATRSSSSPPPGVQTNGLTLCRQLADRLPQGYLTRLTNGRDLRRGAPRPVGDLRRLRRASASAADLKLNYAAHVTGHGWRKLMRLEEPFVYEIDDAGAPSAPLPIPHGRRSHRCPRGVCHLQHGDRLCGVRGSRAGRGGRGRRRRSRSSRPGSPGP